MRATHAGHSPGFTLLEMVVVLVIAATLAAIAYPSYRHIMHRSQRLEAHLALIRLQTLQERHFADHHAYASQLRADGRGDSLPIAAITENGHYDLSMRVDADGQAYVAIARARQSGRQAGDSRCQQFSIDTVGTRRSATATGPWRTEPESGCWS